MRSRTGEDCSRLMFFDIETLPDFSRKNLFGIPEIPDILPLDRCPNPNEFVMGETGSKPIPLVEHDLDGLMQGREIPNSMWFDLCIQAENGLGKARAGIVKLLESYRKKVNDRISACEDATRSCALDKDKCRVLCTGVAIGDSPAKVNYADLTGINADEEEKRVLTEWWEAAAQSTQFCGYNIHGFDLPIIFTRSAYLGVQPTRRINMSKYSGDVLDMLVLMGDKGKLKHVLEYNRIGEEYDGMDGGKVLDMWRAGLHEEIAEYQRKDVDNERELFKHFSGYFWM